MNLGRANYCLIALFATAALFTQYASAAEKLAAKRPNIIFVLTDDQGYGDLSCHGNPTLQTPNIDRIAREGVQFEDFHVSPTCSPTRSALLTGRHEFRNGVTHTILERERLTLDATTLAVALKSAGYTTGIFGKWHLGDEEPYQPKQRGFDEVFIHGAGGIGQTYPGSCGDAPGNKYFDPAIWHNDHFEKTSGYCTDLFFNQALTWIDSVKGKQPFYAHISTNAPHGPLVVRPEDKARYDGKAPENAAKFFGMIANIDDNVGKLLERLKAWDIERETLVIFMNDNGGTAGTSIYNAGMRGSKGSPWIGGTRASSLWRWPGMLEPHSVSKLAAHIDFMPTLMELAGATMTPKLDQQIEGRSLVPLLESPSANWPDRTLFTHVGRWAKDASPETGKYVNCSVRNSRWHLVSKHLGGSGGGKRAKGPTDNSRPDWQLFDISADPGETKDVSADHAGVVKSMAAEYEQWWASVQPQLVNEKAVGPAENPFKVLFEKQFGSVKK